MGREPGVAGHDATTPRSRLTTALRALARTLRRLAGMPDYAAYLEHQRRCHPGRPVLSERDFFTEYLRARYADGPTRCC